MSNTMYVCIYDQVYYKTGSANVANTKNMMNVGDERMDELRNRSDRGTSLLFTQSAESVSHSSVSLQLQL